MYISLHLNLWFHLGVFFSRKISSSLGRAKLYPIERTVGSFRCRSKRCEVCKYITETDRETYKINHRLDCNDKCLVYLLTCKKCKKQYTGQLSWQME